MADEQKKDPGQVKAMAYANALKFDNPRLSSDEIYQMRKDAANDFYAGYVDGLSVETPTATELKKEIEKLKKDLEQIRYLAECHKIEGQKTYDDLQQMNILNKQLTKDFKAEQQFRVKDMELIKKLRKGLQDCTQLIIDRFNEAANW